MHRILALAALTTLSALSTIPLCAAEPSPDVTRVPVVFTGGHETDPRDHGRPVVLIAAALGVKPEVFREAFSQVRPAGPGRGPTGDEARQNKAALMAVLGQYQITNDCLDTVSNFYRYPPGPGGLWKHQDATAHALIKGGTIIGYEITHGGFGYTTPPKVTVPGYPETAPQVEVGFGTVMERNGEVAKIIAASKPK